MSRFARRLVLSLVVSVFTLLFGLGLTSCLVGGSSLCRMLCSADEREVGLSVSNVLLDEPGAFEEDLNGNRKPEGLLEVVAAANGHRTGFLTRRQRGVPIFAGMQYLPATVNL